MNQHPSPHYSLVDCNDVTSSRVSPKTKVESSWLGKKVYKAKGTSIKTCDKLLRVFESGNVIVTNSCGNVCDFVSVVESIEKTKIMPQMSELKKVISIPCQVLRLDFSVVE